MATKRVGKRVVNKDGGQKAFDLAADHVSGYVLRGNNFPLSANRIAGAACGLASLDPHAVLRTAIWALEDSEEKSDRNLAAALLKALPPCSCNKKSKVAA